MLQTVSRINSQTNSAAGLAARAKATLEGFVPKLDAVLKQIWAAEFDNIDTSSASVRALAEHILHHAEEHNLRKAKRVRGAFVYYGYQLFKDDVEDDRDLLYAACSIEAVHTGLLMHDDFMDLDRVRRGLPTTHVYYENYHSEVGSKGDAEHFGHSMAVDVGDLALTLGYRLIADTNFAPPLKLKALQILLDGIINTAYGQAYDVLLEGKTSWNEQDIFDLHYAKTSIYTYQTPLLVGATLAHATRAGKDLLRKYADPGGIAFQIQDDILGLFGDTEKTGKSAFADLRQRKNTLLITYALQHAKAGAKRELERIWGNPDIGETEANIAREIVRDTGSLAYNQKVATELAQKSQAVAPLMRKAGLNSRVIDFLDGIAEYMAEKREV